MADLKKYRCHCGFMFTGIEVPSSWRDVKHYQCPDCETRYQVTLGDEGMLNICASVKTLEEEPKPSECPKSKKGAILFVLFLGILGWIYTWEKDWWLLVLFAIASIFLQEIAFMIGWMVAILIAVIRPKLWYFQYCK